MKTRKLLLLGIIIFTSTLSFAQKYGKTPKDSIECITNISLYSEFYKQNNFKDAYKPWQVVMNVCPQASQNTYIRGINILKYQIDNEKNAQRKERLIDSLMYIWDQRIVLFGSEANNLGRKAVDLRSYRPKAYEEIYNTFRKSVEIGGLATEPAVLYYYFLSAIDMAKSKKADTSLIFDVYDPVSDLIEKNINKNTEFGQDFQMKLLASFATNVEFYKQYNREVLIDFLDAEASKNIFQTIKTYYLKNKTLPSRDTLFSRTKLLKNAELKADMIEKVNLIFSLPADSISISPEVAKSYINFSQYKVARTNVESSFQPFATCKDLIRIYSKKFKAAPNDVALLKKITKILDRKKCTEDPLFFSATENLHKNAPTPESAYLMGKMSYAKKQFAKAAEYLTEAVPNITEKEDKYKAYLLLADVYSNLNQFSQARTYAYKALENKPNEGMPYIIIGDMYVQSSKSCGDNEVTSKAGYWAAVDKYIKAKSIDPSMAEIAKKKINSVSVAFPKQEDLFFYNMKKGDSYRIECWINETTTVRSR